MSWKVPWWKGVYLTLISPFWRISVRLRYWLVGDCGLNCGYVAPYGFVPEADCPIHDIMEGT